MKPPDGWYVDDDDTPSVVVDDDHDDTSATVDADEDVTVKPPDGWMARSPIVAQMKKAMRSR